MSVTAMCVQSLQSSLRGFSSLLIIFFSALSLSLRTFLILGDLTWRDLSTGNGFITGNALAMAIPLRVKMPSAGTPGVGGDSAGVSYGCWYCTQLVSFLLTCHTAQVPFDAHSVNFHNHCPELDGHRDTASRESALKIKQGIGTYTTHGMSLC